MQIEIGLQLLQLELSRCLKSKRKTPVSNLKSNGPKDGMNLAIKNQVEINSKVQVVG